MRDRTRAKFPSWCEDTQNYDLLLSDDVDSLMCYIYQREIFGREVKYFLDVNHKKVSRDSFGIQRLYITKGATENKDNILGLDVALEDYKCWDNHITKLDKGDDYNKYSANLNVIQNINKENYTKKYVVSSFITMLSYYNVDIKTWSDEQLFVLCAIDGLYIPFENDKFRYVASNNLYDLDYSFLGRFISDNLEKIKEIEKSLNLKKGKIKVNTDGQLVTDINLEELSRIFGIDISLPKKKFITLRDYQSAIVDVSNIDSKSYFDIPTGIFNLVLPYRNSMIISTVM